MTPLRATAAGSLRAAAACALLAAAGGVGAQSGEQLRREVAAVGVVERLGAAVPRDAVFREDDGRALSLATLGGHPVLLSFNYTGCPRLCVLQLAGLARALRELGWRGEGFSVVTVSIDPAEQPAQLRRYKESHVRQAGGGAEVARGWRFVTGAAPDVAALADAVGFRYRYDPRTNELAHQATLVVLTGEGRVSGYLHGITYPPDALRTALARAAGGQVASAAEQASLGGFLLTCMGFDPADPAPRALKIMRAASTAALLTLVAFLGVHAARDRRRARSRRAPDAC
jgi:protein SCO1